MATLDVTSRATQLQTFVRQYPNSEKLLPALQKLLADDQQLNDSTNAERTARRILEIQGAAESSRQRSRHREPDPLAARLLAADAAVEDAGTQLLGHAGAVVAHPQPDPLRRTLDADPRRRLRRVAGGVDQQDVEHLDDLVATTQHHVSGGLPAHAVAGQPVPWVQTWGKVAGQAPPIGTCGQVPGTP